MTDTDLLDRYLAEIGRNLPSNVNRDDVVAEISDEIQTRVESGEATIYDAIKEYGHPRIVAARYGSQQALVGPQLVPFYWYTLKLVLATVIGIEIFGSAFAAFMVRDPAPFGIGLSYAWNSVIWICGIVTIIFILIERYRPGAAINFDPSKLPKAAEQPISRMSSGFEFIANFTMVLVLLFGGPFVSKLIAPLTFTGAWYPAWVCTLIAASMVAGSAFATYLNPAWSKARDYVQLIAHLVTLTGCTLMFRIGSFFDMPGENFQNGASMPISADMAIMGSLVVVILCLALATGVTLWKIVRPNVLRGSSSRSTSA